MTRILACAFLCLCLAAPAFAQTTVTKGPITTADKVAWDSPSNVTTVADAATFQWWLRDSVAGSAAMILQAPSCVLVAPATLPACLGSLTQAMVDTINRVGVHNLTLTAWRSDVGESPLGIPFVLISPSAAPTGLRIIRSGP